VPTDNEVQPREEGALYSDCGWSRLGAIDAGEYRVIVPGSQNVNEPNDFMGVVTGLFRRGDSYIRRGHGAPKSPRRGFV